MDKAKVKPILLRMPASLVKKLDAVARAQGRSRTAEVCKRLTDSLKKGGGVSA